MMSRRRFLVSTASLGVLALAGIAASAQGFAVTRTDEEWQLLSQDAYSVLRRGETEPPGYSPLDQEKRAGVFACAGCGAKPLPPTPSSIPAPAGPASSHPSQDRHRHPHAGHRALRADGGALPELRWSSRPRLRRWSRTDRPALLHQRRRAQLHASLTAASRTRNRRRRTGVRGPPPRFGTGSGCGLSQPGASYGPASFGEAIHNAYANRDRVNPLCSFFIPSLF